MSLRARHRRENWSLKQQGEIWYHVFSSLVGKVLQLLMRHPSDATLATKKVLFGKMTNFGQVCIAPDYVFCQSQKSQKWMNSLNY